MWFVCHWRSDWVLNYYIFGIMGPPTNVCMVLVYSVLTYLMQEAFGVQHRISKSYSSARSENQPLVESLDEWMGKIPKSEDIFAIYKGLPHQKTMQTTEQLLVDMDPEMNHPKNVDIKSKVDKRLFHEPSEEYIIDLPPVSVWSDLLHKLVKSAKPKKRTLGFISRGRTGYRKGLSAQRARYKAMVNSKNRYPRFQKETFVFGEDNRDRVDLFTMRKFPFHNVVRLSTGCTGTLVSKKHVLTAAHCVHNGHHFKFNIAMLKVEVPDSMGPRIYFVKRAMIPLRWQKSGSVRDLQRAIYDYAIVELSSPVLGRWHFMEFDWQSDPLKQPIMFLAYPADRYPEMWESTCVVEHRTRSLLLNRCDSGSGSSGSSAFMHVTNKGWRIIGVVSAVVGHSNPALNFNAITRLTLHKLWDICDMMERDGAVHFGVCQENALRHRPARANRFMIRSRTML